MEGRQILKSIAKITGLIFGLLLVVALVTQLLAQRQLSENHQKMSAFCTSISPGTTRAELTSRIKSTPGFRETSASRKDPVVLVGYHTCHCSVRFEANQVVGIADGMCNG